MAKKTIPQPQVGDVVTWVDPASHKRYTPGPYVVVDFHGYRPVNVFLRCLDGKAIYFNNGMQHAGVGIDEIRVDPFLTAARKANLEKKPDDRT